MQHSIDTLPAYLKMYCVTQEPDCYTAEDHAAWRFIMRQCRHFFKLHGVSTYLDGLNKTGIKTDRIPRIDEIDEALRKFGWGAVPVRGFIPPFAFLELQSRKILPIASDMRQVDHILYTSAPDIVHEAAGHAPLLADPTFARYLTHYAALAKKAIFCEEDLDQYEAIRVLSDVKENPDSTDEEIAAAEQELVRATDKVPFISEAAKVARMYWWTAEYGLVGDPADPKIYGAGLLSSIGESRECLRDRIRKVPLSVDCVDQSYDITKPQPQLFVAKNLEHLCDVLHDLEQRMSYKIGGVYGMDTAIAGRTVVTAVLDSGIAVSGKITEYLAQNSKITFFRISGPAQISYHEQELLRQGVAQHPDGFSTPVGNWRDYPDRSPAMLTRGELERIGITEGKNRSLAFVSGFQISGDIAAREFAGDTLLLIKWKNCRVVLDNKVFFEPAWGDFDMLAGSQVVSVYGGAADREKFGDYKLGTTKTSPKRSSLPSAAETATYAAFAEARRLRTRFKDAKDRSSLESEIREFVACCDKNFKTNWLLRLESLELLSQFDGSKQLFSTVLSKYKADTGLFDQTMVPFIDQAINYLHEL